MSFKYGPESQPLAGYTIKRAIQRGGFGEVYYALSDAGKEVALKLLQDNVDIELRGVAQCLNLKHPQLMTIFDVRQNAADEHWIVMEYMSGQTLNEVIAAAPQGLPANQVDRLLSELSQGVEYLHQQGIVHRDLKPANVYVEHSGLKIGDVGLSKFISVSRRSAQTQSVGTVYYMAPEIAHGRYGHEVDVYAMGVMLCEMLTGKLPFDGESTGEILMKQLTQAPDLSAVPDKLRPVVARALEKDPTKRTRSARALSEEFHGALLGRTDLAVPRLAADDIVPPEEIEVVGSNRSPVRADASPQVDRRAVRQPQFKGPLAQPFFVFFIGLIILVMLGRLPLGWMEIVILAVAGAVGWNWWQKHGSEAMNSPDGTSLRHQRARRLNPKYGRQRTPETPRVIDPVQRGAEVTGSMAMAGVVATFITAALWSMDAFLKSPAQAVLFGVGSVLGAWAVIIPAKLCEGRRTDGAQRRLLTMVCGAIAGCVVSQIDAGLSVGLETRPFGQFGDQLAARFGMTNLAALQVTGYGMFFATLMGVRRWWYRVDAFRDRRLSLPSVALTTACGALIGQAFQFPWDWGLLWAMGISATAQLSATWINTPGRS